MNNELLEHNLLGIEDWREYDFNGRVYRITNPIKLITKIGGTTHRVEDADHVTHCVPAPGVGDCVLRWKGSTTF